MTWANSAEIAERFHSETVICECPDDASGPWDCCVCPIHGDDAQAEVEAQHKSEIDAENAWLRYAEMPTMDDYAFEAYETRLGLV